MTWLNCVVPDENERLDDTAIELGCRGAFGNALSIDIVDEVASTNDYLVDHLHRVPVVCLAEKQSQARSRKESRPWYVPPYLNISMSLCVRLHRPLRDLSALSLVVALSVERALTDLNFTGVQVKWPNDIIFNQQKLAGILLDVVDSGSDFTTVIIGIGLNVNMRSSPSGVITQPWTSLALMSGSPVNRNAVAGALLRQMSLDLAVFEVEGFGVLKDRWVQSDWLLGKTVALQLSMSKVVLGEAAGVNDWGQLLLLKSGDRSGAARAFSVGNVSVRCPAETE